MHGNRPTRSTGIWHWPQRSTSRAALDRRVIVGMAATTSRALTTSSTALNRRHPALAVSAACTSGTLPLLASTGLHLEPGGTLHHRPQARPLLAHQRHQAPTTGG